MTTPKFTIGHQMSESGEQYTASEPSGLRYESGATPKFTPGPWEIKTIDEYICSIGPCVAAGDGWYPWLDVSPDDANLIAAAPDLYEALEEIVQWLELGDHEGFMHAKAVAALSKARGEHQ